MKKMITLAAFLFSGFAAHAGDARPVWSCALGFEGTGGGIQILIGSFQTVAKGQIQCSDLIGGQYIQPVKVTIGAEPLALNVGVGIFNFVGGAGQINLMSLQPTDLLGDYLIVQGRAAWALGAGVFTAVHSNFPNLSLNIGMDVDSGIGIQAGLNWMRIEALPVKKNLPVKAKK